MLYCWCVSRFVCVMSSTVQKRGILFHWAFITCPSVSALLSSCRGKKQLMYNPLQYDTIYCRAYVSQSGECNSPLILCWKHWGNQVIWYCSLNTFESRKHWCGIWCSCFSVLTLSYLYVHFFCCFQYMSKFLMILLCCFFSIWRSYLLVDPCEREERVMDGLLVIAMNKHREICSIQSSGGIMLLKDQVTAFVCRNSFFWKHFMT